MTRRNGAFNVNASQFSLACRRATGDAGRVHRRGRAGLWSTTMGPAGTRQALLCLQLSTPEPHQSPTGAAALAHNCPQQGS